MLKHYMFQVLKPYIEISKVGIGLLIILTTAVGFVAGTTGPLNGGLFFSTILGTAVSVMGAGALNNYIERDYDAQMERTMHRPIPSGRLPAANALLYGIALSVLSTVFLAWRVNLLCGFLALMTTFLY